MSGMLLAAGPHAWVVTRWWAALIALLALLLMLGAAHLVVRSAQDKSGDARSGPPSAVRQRRRGIKSLVIGTDGRASTSKLQVVMWTFAVFYALVFLLAWGRSTGCGSTGLSASARAQCAQAPPARAAFSNLVNHPLQPAYYVLLGFPLTAAVAAKALVTSKVADGTLVKPPADQTGTSQGLSEIVSNDQGETDLVDFQYLAFNLLTLAFFALEFLTRPASGLPDLPPTLIALAGLSAATYTTKKALETSPTPTISKVVPTRIPLTAGTHIIIAGGDLGPWSGAGSAARVMLDSVALEITGATSGRIDATLPQAAVDALKARATGTHAELVVVPEDGAPSDPFSVETFQP